MSKLEKYKARASETEVGGVPVKDGMVEMTAAAARYYLAIGRLSAAHSEAEKPKARSSSRQKTKVN